MEKLKSKKAFKSNFEKAELWKLQRSVENPLNNKNINLIILLDLMGWNFKKSHFLPKPSVTNNPRFRPPPRGPWAAKQDRRIEQYLETGIVPKDKHFSKLARFKIMSTAIGGGASKTKEKPKVKQGRITKKDLVALQQVVAKQPFQNPNNVNNALDQFKNQTMSKEAETAENSKAKEIQLAEIIQVLDPDATIKAHSSALNQPSSELLETIGTDKDPLVKALLEEVSQLKALLSKKTQEAEAIKKSCVQELAKQSKLQEKRNNAELKYNKGKYLLAMMANPPEVEVKCVCTECGKTW